MSEHQGPSAATCAFCDYDLAGLTSAKCPECGRAQPAQSAEDLIRADRVWLPIALVGAAAFVALSKAALKAGVVRGGNNTGDVAFVGLPIGFAIVAAIYAIVATEIFLNRARCRRVRTRTVVIFSLAMIVGGFGALMAVLVVTAQL